MGESIAYAAERTGYEIEIQQDSHKALVALYQDPGRFDLHIFDDDVGYYPGSFLADRLLKIKGTAQVILIVSEVDISLAVEVSGVSCIMMKPCPSEAKPLFLSTLASLE